MNIEKTKKTWYSNNKMIHNFYSFKCPLTNVFSVFINCPFLLHNSLFFEFSMVSNITKDFRVLSDSQHLGVIGDLREFALAAFKICMVFHIRLDFCVLRDTFQFRCFRHSCSFRFWNMTGRWYLWNILNTVS